MEDTRRMWPTGSTKNKAYGLQKLKKQAQGLQGACSCSSVYVLWLLTWCFCEAPNCGSRCVFDSFAYSWDSFLPYCWDALYSLIVWAFALSYYILISHVWLLSIGGLLFSEGRWRRSVSEQKRGRGNREE